MMRSSRKRHMLHGGRDNNNKHLLNVLFMPCSVLSASPGWPLSAGGVERIETWF